MSDDNKNQPIIIKKRVKKKHPHHGGSWKIAYADFVTAMMAFFLLMWLISMMNKFQLQGIANYFNNKNQNVNVHNEKNDSAVPKVPKENIKRYKMVMTSKKASPIQANFNASGPSNRGVGLTKTKGVGLSKTKDKKSKDKSEKVTHAVTKSPVDQDNLGKTELNLFRSKLENDLKTHEVLKKYKGHLSFKLEDDGLHITLKGLHGKPMFSPGNANFEKYAKPILAWLSAELNRTHRKVVVIGHTDKSNLENKRGYLNWELSSARANSAVRSLIKNGMYGKKIIRVQGAATTNLLDKYNPKNPVNRRIEIIVLTNKAAKKLLNKE